MTHSLPLARFAAAAVLALGCAAAPAMAQKAPQGQVTEPQTQPVAPPPLGTGQIDFGDDSGAYPNDGECDDRRFAGPGMATFLAWETTGRDASDCQQLMAAGRITLWDPAASLAATQCAAINFGDDSGDFPADNECDDPRFEGRGMAGFVQQSLTMRDATDCQRFCQFGTIGLRDY